MIIFILHSTPASTRSFLPPLSRDWHLSEMGILLSSEGLKYVLIDLLYDVVLQHHLSLCRSLALILILFHYDISTRA